MKTTKKHPFKKYPRYLPSMLVIFTLSVVITIIYFGYKNFHTLTNKTNSPNYQSTPTPFSNHPQPTIATWKTYEDKSYGEFSFEYPSFLPEPTIHSPSKQSTQYASLYRWQIDKMSYGNYEHYIDLRIEGPYLQSSEKELINWIREQNWPYEEGEHQEMAGKSQITYKMFHDKIIVESIFTESESIYPRSWILYFKTNEGIYRIDLNVQGTTEELSNYQTVFNHILSTFKFTK